MVTTEHSTKHEGLLSVGPRAGAQVAREASPEGSAAPGQGGDSWELHRSAEGRGLPGRHSAASVFTHVGFFLLLVTDVPFQWYLS